MKTIVVDKVVELTDEQLAMYSGLTKLQRSVSLKKLQGLGDVDAYLAGGGKAKNDNSRRASASDILTNPNTVAFIESFNSQIVSQAIMGREEMLERLTLMARTSLSDIVDFTENVAGKDDDGNDVPQTAWSIKDSDQLPEDAIKVINKLTASAKGISLETHDQKAAMKQIADIEGFNAAKGVDLTSSDGSMTPKDFNGFYDEEG